MEEKKRNGSGGIYERKAKGTAACLAYLNNYDNEQAWKIFAALDLDKKEMSKEDKAIKIRALERVFETILKFDTGKLKVNSLNDAFCDKNTDASVMNYLCFEFPEQWMNEYKEYMADKDLGCTLNEDQFNEVYRKWEYVYETGKALEQFRMPA